ncbi:DUF2339 domain-containing protein [Parasphingorhabdus flavimaris]|uniref:DUF2339 domain-containing protein n=1 Tax=Parasphingorhabdus flavimaris TaxID=266812 RepID=UPI0030025231
MLFLLFCGFIVLAVLIFDSRKNIRLLRTQIENLEHSLEIATRSDDLAAAANRRAQPAPATIRAKRSEPAESIAAPPTDEPIPEPVAREAAAEARTSEANRPAVSASKRFEDLIGGKLPIWIGGVALVFAGFFLVRFSIEAGLFGPAARCLTAAMFGLLLIGLAEFGNRIPRIGAIFTDDLRIGHSIAGAGIAVLYATLYMASELYGLFGLTASLVGVIAVTILAFILSRKHGPPTAVMGLLGGFAAPYVAGLGPESVAPLVIYLGVFTAGLFGLAIHRGWAWLALLATGGSVIWTSALLFMDIAEDSSIVGLFIMLLAIGGVLTLSRTGQNYGLPKSAIRSIPLVAGLVQLIMLAPLIQFSPVSWLFFAVLAVFAIALGWRDEEMTPAAAGALGLAFAMVGAALSDYGPDHGDLLPAIGFAILFGLAGHIFALREKSGRMWGLIGLAAPVGMLVLTALLGRFDWSENIWGAVCSVVAATAAIMAWRTHLIMKSPVMPLASAITAILLAAALWLWTPDRLAAIIPVAVAFGLAAWARHCDNRTLALQTFAAAMTGGLIAAVLSVEMISALFASLAGETDLYSYLPAVGPMIVKLLIPSFALVALAGIFGGTLDKRSSAAIAAAGVIGTGSFAYLLLKQILAIGPIDQFMQFGFAERITFTHLLALAGWLLLRRTWPADWADAATKLGWALVGVALFRFVYFDLMLLSPTSVYQAVGPAPFANLATLHYFGTAIWLWLFASSAASGDRANKWVRPLEIGSLLTTIAAVLVTVRQAVHGTNLGTVMISASDPDDLMNIDRFGYTTTETYLYSAGLLLLAIAWLARGIQTSNAMLRIAGLLLLTLVTFKVFLVDAAQLEGVLRILSFLGLGIALIGIGWIYGKIMQRDVDASGEQAAG